MNPRKTMLELLQCASIQFCMLSRLHSREAFALLYRREVTKTRLGLHKIASLVWDSPASIASDCTLHASNAAV